jgi:hypothetical protein
MTTAFQTVIDYSESIGISKMKRVGQTISRDGVVRATSLGGQTWDFEVVMPDGLAWTTMRPLIEKMEALDRTETGVIRINKAGHSWLSGYQGNYASVTSIVANVTSGTSITITSGPVLTSGFRFRAGDFIQLGSTGKVYSVADDVPPASNIVTLNRPVREAAGNYTLLVGQNVSWNVICVQFPSWQIFARNQVRWNGPFRFAEVL